METEWGGSPVESAISAASDDRTQSGYHQRNNKIHLILVFNNETEGRNNITINPVTVIVSSDRSSCSDDGLLYIYLSGHFFRFSLSPLMQLMLQVSLKVA